MNHINQSHFLEFHFENPNLRATERPTAHYIGRGKAEQHLKVGALLAISYTPLCFDLSCVDCFVGVIFVMCASYN